MGTVPSLEGSAGNYREPRPKEGHAKDRVVEVCRPPPLAVAFPLGAFLEDRLDLAASEILVGTAGVVEVRESCGIVTSGDTVSRNRLA